MNKWVLVALFSFVAAVAVAQDPAQVPGAKEFQEGQEAANQGDWDKAIPALEAAVKANPDLFASNYYLGWGYLAKRDWEKAGRNFATFLDKVGNNPKAAEMISHATRQGGIAFARASNANRAVPLLEKAVAAKPNDKEAHFFLGVVLLQNNREAEAQDHFTKVIQLDPSLGDAYYYSGRIAFNRENWDQATERLNKFIELKPDASFAADAHFMLGSMAVRQAEADPAKNQEAITHLNKFLELKPTAPQAPQAHYILGSLAAQRDDNETARMHFEKYLELQPQGAQAEEVKKFLADLQQGEAE